MDDAESASPHLSDEESNPLFKAAWSIEAEMAGRPPSLMKAGVLCLLALRYGILCLDTSPAEMASDQSNDDDALMAWRLLPCLILSLHGAVAMVAADYLAHPDRPTRDSLLNNTGRV